MHVDISSLASPIMKQEIASGMLTELSIFFINGVSIGNLWDGCDV